MKGLIRRIQADIKEVNHQIKVDLGLEQPTPEELEKTDYFLDFVNGLPENESEEAKAFGKVLDGIWEQYENAKLEALEEPDTSEEPNFKVVEEILANL